MIVLMGILLLGGMIFYVINVGEQLNGHLSMQNAADATAISGATWMARSINVVAMNNMAQTRMLAMVPILDSLPQATAYADSEVTAWLQRIDEQIPVIQVRQDVANTVTPALVALRDRFARQKNILDPMDQFFNHSTFRMEQLTRWQLEDQTGPPPHGTLWRSAVSLDEFSQSVRDSAAVLSQSNAKSYGQADGAEEAFITPVLPEFPGQRSGFRDFERPVKYGIIPEDSPPYRMGPFDRLYGWRDLITKVDQFIPSAGGGVFQVVTSGFNFGAARQSGGYDSRPAGGRWTTTPVGYTVFGPFQWMLRSVIQYAGRSYQDGALGDTFFSYYMETLASAKRDYMWGAKGALRTIHKPHWITTLNEAAGLADRGDVNVYQTMFYRVTLHSSKPMGAPDFLKSGTYALVPPDAALLWLSGWRDPRRLSMPLLAEWVWVDSNGIYDTDQEPAIGINLELDASGKPILQRAYLISYFVFGGIDVGGDENIEDPSNYSSVDDQALPAPVVMADNAREYQSSHDAGNRRSQFTWLGVARKGNAPYAWAERFGSGNPFGEIVSLAQVEIFNPTSWDLWTQDWRVKLVPVSNWDDWIERLSAGIDQASATETVVDTGVVSEVYRYLSGLNAEMFQQMMQH